MAYFLNYRKLKAQLNRFERGSHKKAWLLILPAVCFVLFFFVTPLFGILCKSFLNPEIDKHLSTTVQALQTWDHKTIPDESVFRALVNDLSVARKKGVAGSIGRRLGYEDERYSVLINTTLYQLPLDMTQPLSPQLINISPLWAEPSTWQAIVNASGNITSYYLLNAFDHKVNGQTGKIEALSDDQALFVSVLFRTLWMSGLITILCTVLGFPLAYWLSCQTKKVANLLLVFVLLPFWSSLLVCTLGWIVLLQPYGPLNSLLQLLLGSDQPLSLIPSRLAVYLSMLHILLPFMVLPLYAVMRGIKHTHIQAAISLGAHPFYAFCTVYLPQTYSGLRAGMLLVFIMAMGYYITPSLLGRPSDQMVSYYIAYFTNTTNNWGMAAALSLQLILIVLLLSWGYSKLSYGKKAKRL